MAASDTGKIIGKLIREYRIKSGMKQKDLADCMGFDAQVVSDYERGRRVPGIDLLIRFCECTNVDVIDMIKDFKQNKMK